MIYQILFYSCTKIVSWLPIILVRLSNDVHLNQRPHFQNSFFNFMSWNVNSLAEDNFNRVRHIEAQNSIFNYDLISFCETSLSDSIRLPETLLNGYTFVPANNLENTRHGRVGLFPANTRHGGVGHFYKYSLPVIVRNDLSFDESILVELKFASKKNNFLLFYIEVLHLILILLI